MQLVKGKFLSCHHFVYRTQGCFHNASGYAKYISCSCSQSQRRVKLTLRKIHKINACRLYHTGQLPGGQYGVHIAVAVHFHFRALYFVLLGCTGHDRYHKHVFRRGCGALCIEGFYHGAQHGMRTLAGGQMV